MQVSLEGANESYSQYALREAKAVDVATYWPPTFYAWMVKRAFDWLAAIILIPSLVVISVLLLVVNPFLNPGPLLCFTKCMGRYGEPFCMISFRSSFIAGRTGTVNPGVDFDIGRTRLGQFLCRSQIEALPRILNILRGDMSFVGPQPDPYDLAKLYRAVVPGYWVRLAVRPGMLLSGDSLGDARSPKALKMRAIADVAYVSGISIVEGVEKERFFR